MCYLIDRFVQKKFAVVQIKRGEEGNLLAAGERKYNNEKIKNLHGSRLVGKRKEMAPNEEI